MMHYAFKFRLYPNKRQREYFENNFGACRFIWNLLIKLLILCFVIVVAYHQ